MNNQMAIDYLKAVSHDLELLKKGEGFDKHDYNSMIDLVYGVLDFLTAKQDEQAQ